MPPLDTSAILPLHEAIATAINADGTLSGLLAGEQVYSLIAPRGAVPDYIVIGDSSATGFAVFHRAGEVSAVSLHIWTSGEESRATLRIYQELRRLLHLKPLAVTGHRLCTGELSLTTVSADPGGEMVHGVALYRPITLPT